MATAGVEEMFRLHQLALVARDALQLAAEQLEKARRAVSRSLSAIEDHEILSRVAQDLPALLELETSIRTRAGQMATITAELEKGV
jgi:ribosomal protein L16/L10AE